MSWSSTVRILGSGAIPVSFQAQPQDNDASCTPRDNTIAVRDTLRTTATDAGQYLSIDEVIT